MRKENLSLVYKMLVLIIISIGLFLNFKFIGFRTGFVYFTLQSNILCFIFYVAILLYLFISGKNELKGNIYYIFRGLISANIILTMFIYTALEVTNNVSAYDGHFIECFFVHYLTPLLVLFDYILFDKKGNMKWYYPFIWSIVIILYGIFNFVYTAFGGKFFEGNYAYAFFDVERFGIFQVIIYCVVIYLFFIAFNSFVVFLDRKAGDKK